MRIRQMLMGALALGCACAFGGETKELGVKDGAPGAAARKLQTSGFLLNKDFKKNVKYYLCLFSASWCGPCRREMPRIAKTYAESLKDDPNVELIHFSRDREEDKALAWAKEYDVKFPVVKYNGGNPLDLHTRVIPHLFIVDADGKLLEEGHPAKLFTNEKLNALKTGTFVKAETAAEKVVATWWDGPRMRPGVALVVEVGAIGKSPNTMNVTVDRNGSITLPHLFEKQPIYCDGFTLETLKLKLVKAYSSYYRQPMVEVSFAPYDGKGVSPWGAVTVLGEVGKPGPVNMPASMGLTITKVLKSAGGCKPSADKTRIRVTRCDKDGNQTRTFVNINEISKGNHEGKNMPLRPGDVVWVPAK